MIFFCLSIYGLGQVLPIIPDNQFLDDQSIQHMIIAPKDRQFIPHESIIITKNDDFESQGFPGLGTIDDPYRIEDFNITAIGSSIRMFNLSAHFCIKHIFLNGLSSAQSGIELHNVTHGTVKNNVVINYLLSGITLQNSRNTIIANNNVSNINKDWILGFGIFLEDSHNSTISNNTVSNNNGYGIHFSRSNNGVISNNLVSNNNGEGINLYYSNNNAIYNNIITNRYEGGIRISYSTEVTISNNIVYYNWEGIYLYESNNVKISNNSVSHNGQGLELVGSNNITIFSNIVSNNSEYGISMDEESSYCNVSWNSFMSNNLFVSSHQANDDGRNNTFDQNYWDDWTEPDTEGDGIVDNPYPIDGDANNQDEHPRAAPTSVLTSALTLTPILSENILIGLLLLVIIFFVFGLLILKQKRV